MRLGAFLERVQELLGSRGTTNGESQILRRLQVREAKVDELVDKRIRKGDPTLLGDEQNVDSQTAEQYLGISKRQRQKLIKAGVLDTVGRGKNRMVTTESLRKYVPPRKNPNLSERKRTGAN